MTTAILTAPPIAETESDNDERYEIVDGTRVELPPMSADGSYIVFELARALANFAVSNRLGRAASEVLIRLPLPTDRQRRPDAFFVSYSRWPANRPVPRQNAWEVCPELCAEVVSPTDEAEDLREKVEEYFAAGVRLVWVVYPRLELVDIYENGSAVRTLRRADSLDGGLVLPGFTLPLAELFPAAQ